MVARGVERRRSFLAVLERGVYRNPSSPFLLLRRAIEHPNDVATSSERSVSRRRSAGSTTRACVTLSEFKSAQLVRQPARRAWLPRQQRHRARPGG